MEIPDALKVEITRALNECYGSTRAEECLARLEALDEVEQIALKIWISYVGSGKAAVGGDFAAERNWARHYADTMMAWAEGWVAARDARRVRLKGT